jgi:hypothetical protein
MCDWDEKEYPEYLLWVEAEAAKARLPERVAPPTPDRHGLHLTAPSPVSAEA